MRIPEKITIIGVEYEVCYNDGAIHVIDETGEEIVHETVANIDFMNCRINISEEIEGQIRDLSFMHELVHGELFSMGYQLERSSMPNTEEFVEGYAQIWLQVMNQILDYNLKEQMVEELIEEIGEEQITRVHWYLE